MVISASRILKRFAEGEASYKIEEKLCSESLFFILKFIHITDHKTMSNKNFHRGQITQIIGPVLDVAFQPGQMPNIFNALCVQTTDKGRSSSEVICEVQQLLGDHCVRAVSMSGTDGLMRGMSVIDTCDPFWMNT